MKPTTVNDKCFAAKVRLIENADNAYFLQPVRNISVKDVELFGKYETKRLKDYLTSLNETLSIDEVMGAVSDGNKTFVTNGILNEIKFIHSQIKRIERSENIC